MAGQLLLINPRRRRRAKKSHRRARRGRRRMSALQMKYFGGGARSNPRRRRRRSSAKTVARRSYRRGRASARRFGRSVGFSLPSIQSNMKTALIGAGGAVAVDVLMGQANKFLPADWQSRLDSSGSVNWKYYVAKGALAIGLGVAGARYGGRYRGAILTMAQGSLMVQAYELLREVIPQDFLPLGYYTSGNVTMPGMPGGGVNVGMGKYLPRATLQGMRGRMGRLGASPYSGSTLTSRMTRIGS